MTDSTSAGSSNSCAECSRLRRELWLLKNTAKQYSGELADEVARLCVRALLGTSDETNEQPAQNMHSDEWWQAELNRCVGFEQAKYRALFDAYAELKAGDPEVTAGVRPALKANGGRNG